MTVSNTNITITELADFPYYDDFDESKNYHKITFRPGYAVQARELTQMQTIQQSQIERFGGHVFKNGSIVVGGQMSISNATFINLQSTYAGSDIDPSVFVGEYIQWSANTRARAYVLAYEDATDDTPPTLAIKYLTGKVFGHSDTIKIVGGDTYANLAATASNGQCKLASIQEGIFFINGYFVKTPSQTIMASAYTTAPNCKIGLEYAPTIVTENDDADLLDPAQEASNYQAPGATRLRIDLALSTRPLDSEDDETKFIELMRWDEGTLENWVRYPIYSEIAETLARRTFDESGSYTVKPFFLSFKDHATDDDKFMAVLSPGKAYIRGYEFETIADTEIEMDRARSTININNYDLTCTYGNFFVGQNLNGTFDHTTFALVDVHSIPYQYINRSTQTTYDSTKIGTARVRNIIYYGSANAENTSDRTYKVSLTGTKFNKLQTNCNTVAALTSNSVGLWNGGSILSANADAYMGASLKITRGASIETYKIVRWDGTNKIATLSRNMITTPTSSSNAVISFDIAAAESLTISALTAGAPSARANVNFSVLNKFPATVNGDAYLSETNLDALVWNFPQSYIKDGSITDQDLTYRKSFSTTFTANVATIAVDVTKEAFSGNVSGAISTTLLQNYLVIGSTGDIVKLTSVSVDGTQTATLTAENYSGSATVHATVNLNAGNNTLPKRKTFISGNTTHFVGHAANAIILGASSMNTAVYLVAGQAVIQNPSRIKNVPMSLYVSDVKNITAIYNLNGAALPSVGASLSAYTNLKSRYILDNGQRDAYYDHASISLSPYAGTGLRGPLIVCYDYYDHGAGQTDDGLGYFSVDSYPNANTTAGYAAIPSYTKSDGNVLELRDCIDFRPNRTNASNTSPNFTINRIRLPIMNEDFTADYEYYIARRDILMLTPSNRGRFVVVQGNPSQYPVEPNPQGRGMLLWKVLVPPYTESYKDVRSTFVENKRYTMRDIGVLEKRIETLEYYETLSRLEAQASSQVILDEFGLERTKYGILVDDFTGHSVGDVLNLDYKCSINKVTGSLGPAWLRKSFDMRITDTTNIAISRDRATLDYDEVTFISQPMATRYENVQPFMLADFIGDILLDPSVVSFVSTTIAPTVVIS